MQPRRSLDEHIAIAGLKKKILCGPCNNMKANTCVSKSEIVGDT